MLQGLVAPTARGYHGLGTTGVSSHISLGQVPHTATKIPYMYSFSGNCVASVPVHVSVSYSIFPGTVHIFGCCKIDRPILEMYI